MVKICLLFPEDGVCNADGGHSVFCIEVSADAAGIVFIEDGAADKDKDARRLFPQETDGFLHAPHSGCHQGGEADQADILLQGAGKNFLRGHVLAKIKNPVAVVFQQDFDNIFPNIMDIPFDRCQNDAAAFCSRSRQAALYLFKG